MKMRIAHNLLFLLLISSPCFAQVHDAGGWIGLGAKFPIKKRIDLAVDHQVRTFAFSSKVDQIFIEPELRYMMKNGIRWSIAYRPSLKFDNELGVYFRHRYHIQVQYGLDLGDWDISTRVRFQQRFVPIRNSERLPTSDQPMALRNKWAVEYTDLKKLKPFIQFEYFVGLSGTVPAEFTTLRYKGGVEFDLKKKLELSVFYMAEQEISGQQPWFYHVIGIVLSREFKIKRKN